jgi:acyl-CoA synthetase (NDP forming)
MVELLADVAFRIAPLTDVDATEMLAGIKGARVLDGYRGAPPADKAALQDLLLRVSALADAVPAIRELELNPVRALPRGAVALDARVRLGALGRA